MKTYLIKNTDLYFDGKVVPEGSIIELPDNAAKLLMLYLEEIVDTNQLGRASASNETNTITKKDSSINKRIHKSKTTN